MLDIITQVDSLELFETHYYASALYWVVMRVVAPSKSVVHRFMWAVSASVVSLLFGSFLPSASKGSGAMFCSPGDTKSATRYEANPRA